MALALTVLAVPAARATDTWTTVAPGIEHLHRVTGSQDYHVMRIDLRRPEIWLRATGPGQNGQRTSAWASSVGATVAINGDLWDADNWNAYEPLGLAVGDGWKWRDDTDVWSFFACDVNKRCGFNPWGNLEANNPRWHNAVGGMQDLLVINGVGQSYSPAYYQQRNPRTAIGLSQDGATLILLVVDGRRAGAAGMNFAELTAVMLEFGAYNAMNNDGGGSSTLVIHGAVQNTPSDGGERIVANHLGIMVADHTDATCVGAENSRVCTDNTNMRTCTGGLDRGVGDCGYYGLRCEQKEQFAYCVDPRCTNGGQQAVCAGNTAIGFCTDGVYSEGDCAGFGLPCVSGLGTAWCWAEFYQATPEASSLGAAGGGSIDVVDGQPTTVWFELRNTGRMAWDANTRLAPMPRDGSSSLAAPDWIASHRITAVDNATPPGQVGRFIFALRAPGPGDFELQLGLVQEGVAWFADSPSGGGPLDGTLRVSVHATVAPDAGVAADATRPDTITADTNRADASSADGSSDVTAAADVVLDAHSAGDVPPADIEASTSGESDGQTGCSCSGQATPGWVRLWIAALVVGLRERRRR
ncbi:MAG: phosphodiester glycosidase family protein [Pseudomonadota bacterium]